MAKQGFSSGMKCGPPAKGKNGPGDGGKSDGTRHFKPPLPKVNGPRPDPMGGKK